MWAELCRGCLEKPKNRLPDMSMVVSRSMDMERQFCVGSVRDRVQPLDRNVMCVLCRDMYAMQEGLCCTRNTLPSAPHFYCRDCFSDVVRVQCDGSSRGALIASEGAILCPVCTEPPERPETEALRCNSHLKSMTPIQKPRPMCCVILPRQIWRSAYGLR